MTIEQAYEVLGLSIDSDIKEVKRRYRQLMQRLHPDAVSFRNEGMCDNKHIPYSVTQINEAYDLLYKKRNADKKITDNSKNSFHKYTNNSYDTGNHNKTKDSGAYDTDNAYDNSDDIYDKWDAPENNNAYTFRNIYHYIEDSYGEHIGAVIIARGKYIWKEDEDFSLFLKSIRECSERLLNEADKKRNVECDKSERMKIMAQLAYLLAQQFVSADNTLNKYASLTKTQDSDIYFLPAMLEVTEDFVVRAGMKLYPEGIKNHRLYLKNSSSKTVGYLSFKDDRLYYIIIPLLEQKIAQVKCAVSKEQDRLNTRGKDKYKNVDFWIKVPYECGKTLPESLNLQIEKLILRYIKMY